MVLAPKTNKPVASHHKKMSGSHHKRNKPYHKTYWPYLPMLAIAGFALLLNIVWGNLSLTTDGKVLGASTGITSQQLLDETNQDRANLGISSLQADDSLSQAAQAKAQDMASNNYWSHVTPDGRQPWSFAKDAGYDYSALGENLAYGFNDPDAVVQGWLASPEHRSNMLDIAYQNVGFGIVRAADYQGKGPQTIVVALYGAPVNVMSVTPTVVNPVTLPARTVARAEQLPVTLSPEVTTSLLIIAIAGAGIFIVRHLRSLHRVFAYGHAFVVHHPHLDVLIIATVALSVLLTRTAGFIH